MYRIKAVSTLIIFILSCNFVFSQGEIIDRKTKAGKDFNLKILQVKNDSITYKYFGKTKTIPLSSVIAYRVDFNTDNYTFPDPKDKDLYVIKDNLAYSKGDVRPDVKNKNLYVNKLLKNYTIQTDSFNYSTLHKKIRLSGSSKQYAASPKRPLYLILKTDSLNAELHGKIYKITNDSILYLCIRSKKENHFYAINKSDIKYVGIELPEAFTQRIIIGCVSCIFVPPFPFLYFIPSHVFSHPLLKQFDIENSWKLSLIEKQNN